MGDDGFYVGLGYASSQREEQSLVAQGDENATDTPKNPADTLIQAYLQQCLDFHEVQEDNRRGQVNNQKLPEPQQNPVAAHVSTASATSNDEPRQRNQQEQAKEIQEAQSRAQAILKRFEQQQQKLLGNSKNGVLQDDLPVSSNAISETSSNDFEKRRRACFEREAQRRHAALLKNLEYVANKQSTRMNELAALQKQTAEWEGRLDNHYTAVLEERKRLRKQAEMAKLCQVQQAGVGTKRRKTVDKQLERTGHAPSRQGQQQEQYATTVAVYVSGMPVNDKASFGEDTIRNLFCSYGKIQKIHFYRNKKTGELKGDGLIIYEKVGENNADVLLQTVCSQLNYAELPSGDVLRVEPAESNKKKTKLNDDLGRTIMEGLLNKAKSTAAACASQQEPLPGDLQKKYSDTSVNHRVADGTSQADDDDDLDDFFDSL